jgi:hypothetical protein
MGWYSGMMSTETPSRMVRVLAATNASTASGSMTEAKAAGQGPPGAP